MENLENESLAATNSKKKKKNIKPIRFSWLNQKTEMYTEMLENEE